MRKLVEQLKQALAPNYFRELERSIRGLECKAEELREERDRILVERRS